MAFKYRLGVDIGGTFTDATLINEQTGEIHIGKVTSTPKDPSLGFLDAVHRMLRKAEIQPEEVEYIVHGTTVATNCIIEGKIARTGFVTSDGFRDMLEIARQVRPSLYDLQFEKLKPMVPRYLCFGVPERLDGTGQVLTPLDSEAVRRVAARLREEQVESIAVCFLHSYANPAHEKLAGQILGEVFPQRAISLSAEVAPEFREYLRASTTVINACIRPVVARYLQSIEDRLRAEGLEAELLVMQSNGGVLTFSEASERPVFIVESGPAAGVISATYLGGVLGHKDVISFDMGGTTAKVGLVRDGTPQVTKDYEVGSIAQAGVTGSHSSGYPIRTPVIDLVEIGAGGGSIAWVDSGGVLRVGPQSAGADPGPACYGKGGADPTITDANLVLGRLNPKYFLGGEIKLDVDAAHRAIKEHCANALKLDVVKTAHGIVEIANSAMVNALRIVSVQRGYDPRDFILMSFGGAGPVHTNRLAAETEIPLTVIPMSPGTTSAMGLLVTDLKHDYSTTMIEQVDKVDVEMLETVFLELTSRGRSILEREEVAEDQMRFVRQADIRYVGQSYELTITLQNDKLGCDDVRQISEKFHSEHDRAYGHSAPQEPIEFVNLRISAIGSIIKPKLRKLEGADSDVSDAKKTTRPVYFAESGGYVDCPIYDRYRLGPGHAVAGPAVVEEIDSTTVIHPRYIAHVDDFGNLILTGGNPNNVN